MTLKRILLSAAVLSFVIAGSPATSRAGLNYTLRFDETDYQGTTGNTIAMMVVLDEVFDGNNATGSSRLFDAASNGLDTANYSASISGTGDNSFTGAPLGIPGADYLGGGVLVDGNNQNMLQFASMPPIRGTTTDGITRSVAVGTLFVQAGTLGSINTVSLADFDVALDDLIISYTNGDPNFVVENSAGFSYGSATVTAVPEPSAAALVGWGIAGVLFRRRRAD